jgi:hypothetical protein
MNANVWWVAAVPVALLAGCQTPPSVPLAPYAQRDLTVPWSERTYWAHPDGGVAAYRPALRPPPAPLAAGAPDAAPVGAAPRPLVPTAGPSTAATAQSPAAVGSPAIPAPATPPATPAPAAPTVEPAPAAWLEPVHSTRTACAPGSC